MRKKAFYGWSKSGNKIVVDLGERESPRPRLWERILFSGLVEWAVVIAAAAVLAVMSTGVVMKTVARVMAVQVTGR